MRQSPTSFASLEKHIGSCTMQCSSTPMHRSRTLRIKDGHTNGSTKLTGPLLQPLVLSQQAQHTKAHECWLAKSSSSMAVVLLCGRWHALDEQQPSRWEHVGMGPDWLIVSMGPTLKWHPDYQAQWDRNWRMHAHVWLVTMSQVTFWHLHPCEIWQNDAPQRPLKHDHLLTVNSVSNPHVDEAISGHQPAVDGICEVKQWTCLHLRQPQATNYFVCKWTASVPQSSWMRSSDGSPDERFT